VITPKDKYHTDTTFHQLVNLLESFVEKAQFTPSELREAAVLACINYEMRHIRDQTISQRVEEALGVLNEFTGGKQKPASGHDY